MHTKEHHLQHPIIGKALSSDFGEKIGMPLSKQENIWNDELSVTSYL